ncbi:hypothetical protein Mgra_00007131 [Meloidogyne graminicola]|uniref:Uncharacterized protein n=1 Tax=Meloidogyne graminicola TaxID=189291 RepID=A0A8S9ZJ52_9BILA|nr:hypothetical protein Mgra_00007131 [Meloidogyne graminicola]
MKLYLAFFLFFIISLINKINSKPHPNGFPMVRRDANGGDLDDLLTEFRAKGSRMRFGKRSSSSSSSADSDFIEAPIYYIPDRFMWFQ